MKTTRKTIITVKVNGIRPTFGVDERGIFPQFNKALKQTTFEIPCDKLFSVRCASADSSICCISYVKDTRVFCLYVMKRALLSVEITENLII